MQDNFPSAAADSQARNFEAITPDDDNDLPRRYKAIYVGVGGTMTLVGDNDPAGVEHTVPDGAVLICSPVRILEGGTASGLVGWF